MAHFRTLEQSFFPWGHTGGAHDSEFIRDESGGRGQYARAVLHAAAEVDGGRFFKVFGRAGDLADPEAEHHGLRDHLVVEDKIVGVLEQRQRQQQLPRERSEAGVVLQQLHDQKQVLEGRQ